MTQVFGKLVDDEDDQVEGVVPTTSRWWSKEGAWQGGGVDKGGGRLQNAHRPDYPAGC